MSSTFHKILQPYRFAYKYLGGLDCLICSMGGVGTTMMIEYMSKWIRTNRKHEIGGVKHLMKPPTQVFLPRRAIFLFGTPFDPVLSLWKRKHLDGIPFFYYHFFNMHGNYGLPSELELLDYLQSGKERFCFEEQIRNWLYTETPYPRICIRYENIWEHAEELIDFAGLPEEALATFPKYKKRSSDWKEEPEEVRHALVSMYKGLNDFVDSLDPFTVCPVR
jgi:hypothetical protein